MIKVKEIIKIFFGLLITASALYLFFNKTNLNDIGSALTKTNLKIIFFSCILSILSLWFRGLRWSFLLPEPSLNQHKNDLFKIASISFMANNLLPMRLGEAVRVYLLNKNNKYSMHVSLGSLIFERLLDAYFYSTFVIIPSFFYDFENVMIFKNIRVLYFVKAAWILFFCISILFGFLRFFPSFFTVHLRSLAEKIRIKKVSNLLLHFIRLIEESTKWLFCKKKFLISLILTLPTVLCYGIIIYIVTNSIGANINFTAMFFTQGMIACGVSLPSSPGYIGTLHYALMKGLEVFNVDKNTAAASAVLYHLFTWTSTVVVGIFFYFKMSISYKDIKIAKEVAEKN